MNEDFDRDRILSTARARGDAGPLPAAVDCQAPPRFHPPHPGQRACSPKAGRSTVRRCSCASGLYGDGLDARLFTARWERVRGARAIVDRKLAAGEWTVAQAVDFFDGADRASLTAPAAGGGRRHRHSARATSCLHGRPPAAREPARRVPAAHGRARLAARLPRPAALVRQRRRSRCSGRSSWPTWTSRRSAVRAAANY